MMAERNHKQILREELSKRMGANPQYSLRAFARDLKLSPQQLSNVMNGRKGLSAKAASLLAERLGLSPQEREYFLSLVQSQFARSASLKKVAKAKLNEIKANHLKTSNLTLDSFRVISDWYHFALLELFKVADFRSKSAEKLAKALEIPASEVKMALERLERLELIKKSNKGYIINQDTIMTTDGVPSEGLRKFHQQVLNKALAAVTLQAIDERYLSSSFLPIHTNDLPEARAMIQEFRKKFVDKISKPGGNRVYALSMQLFDLLPNLQTQEGNHYEK